MPNSLGMSPLMKASELGDAAVVHALLRVRGIDVNAARPDGSTALICACSDDIPRSGSTSGALETVRALLAVPCINANAATGATAPVPGLTALMCAASRGDAAIVEALLHVADILVSARSRFGHSALRLAMENRHKDAADLLSRAVQKKNHGALYFAGLLPEDSMLDGDLVHQHVNWTAIEAATAILPAALQYAYGAPMEQFQEHFPELSLSSCSRKGCLAVAAHTCAACKSRKYCSKACQKLDWPSHKATCHIPAR